jgi:thiamine biosynthesis lipoprotein
MMSNQCTRTAVAIAVGLLAGAGLSTGVVYAAEPKLDRFQFSEPHMGVPWEIVLYAADGQSANLAAAAAYRRIAEIDAALSDYKDDSEVNRLNATAGRGTPVSVGNDLWTVLNRSQEVAAKSEGAFDVTVGPMVRLWRRARRQKEFPKAELLSGAKQVVGYRLVKLEATKQTVELTRPGMRIDFGGIGMGYAADEAIKVLKSRGITRAMIDASGDVVCADGPPEKSGWIVGIAPADGGNGKPTRYLSLTNASVTTSGDAYQFVEFNGVRYSHIVDPNTGLGLTTRCAVTIVARDGITADSVATAVSVMGMERGLAYVEADPSLAAFFECIVDGSPRITESSRLKAFLVDPQ